MMGLFGRGSDKGKEKGALLNKVVQVGQYQVRVEALLGQGGYADIYRVRDAASGQAFALKHLRLNGDAEHISDVQREAKTMAKLRGHPNILRLHAVSFAGTRGAESDGFFLMDLCPSTLLQLLQQRGFKLDEVTVVMVFESVCRAVGHMHSLSPPLAHRDLKAENVLRLADGTWVLCDFGSATTRAQVYETTQEIAAEEEVIRKHTTPAYRSPEMWDLLGRQLIDTKADIWALGVLLFVLLFGRLPFGDSKLLILHGKLEVPPGRHPALCQLIRDCLAVDPAARPDIQAVLLRLADIRGSFRTAPRDAASTLGVAAGGAVGQEAQPGSAAGAGAAALPVAAGQAAVQAQGSTSGPAPHAARASGGQASGRSAPGGAGDGGVRLQPRHASDPALASHGGGGSAAGTAAAAVEPPTMVGRARHLSDSPGWPGVEADKALAWPAIAAVPAVAAPRVVDPAAAAGAAARGMGGSAVGPTAAPAAAVRPSDSGASGAAPAPLLRGQQQGSGHAGGSNTGGAGARAGGGGTDAAGGGQTPAQPRYSQPAGGGGGVGGDRAATATRSNGAMPAAAPYGGSGANGGTSGGRDAEGQEELRREVAALRAQVSRLGDENMALALRVQQMEQFGEAQRGSMHALAGAVAALQRQLAAGSGLITAAAPVATDGPSGSGGGAAPGSAGARRLAASPPVQAPRAAAPQPQPPASNGASAAAQQAPRDADGATPAGGIFWQRFDPGPSSIV